MLRRWPYTFAVCLSLIVGATAVWASNHYDVPLRDPDGFLGPAYVRLPVIGLLFFAAGIVPVAIRRGGFRGAPTALREIIRDDWSWKRVWYIGAGLISFYICYVSYRNLKSDLPLVRERYYDTEMLRLDHWMFFGNNPGPVLHDMLGTNIAAQVLATAYVAYLPLIPLTLGAFLVWGKDLSLGAWYATALSLNWVLGVISYYMIPTYGPAFVQTQMYDDLADTSAAALQGSLFRAATRFYEDPSGGSTYGIAGFASLHVSVVFTAALFFYQSKQKRVVQIAGWVFFVLTVLATIYFGWHYLADDVAGVLIGWMSVAIGAWASGNTKRQRRRRAELEDASTESITTPKPDNMADPAVDRPDDLAPTVT